MSDRIRTLAVAVVRRGDRVLVERGADRVTGALYHRAIGGGIEFGERAADAAAREWREELGLEIETTSLLGVLESVFTHEGRPGHEIVFVFDALLRDPSAYERERFDVTEGNGLRHEAEWVGIDEARRGAVVLVPEGLAGLLSSEAQPERGGAARE